MDDVRHQVSVSDTVTAQLICNNPPRFAAVRSDQAIGVYVSLSTSSDADAVPSFQAPKKVTANLGRDVGWDVRKNKRMMADLNNDG